VVLSPLRFRDVPCVRLIAGTYTPHAAGMGARDNLLLLLIWGLCLTGLVLNFLFWDRLKVLHMAVQLPIDWLLVFFWDNLKSLAAIAQVRWGLAGGVSYTIGVFFCMHRRMP